jgi:hypothetical protein
MIKTFTVALFLTALVGCGKSDPQLPLSLSDIKILCDDVGRKEWSLVNARDTNRAISEDLNQIKNGKVAECELEYRIKQQEANKPF